MSAQQRVRYHEYMRPRHSNPTYSSNNVGVTMGLIYLPQNQTSLMKLSSPDAAMNANTQPVNNTNQSYVNNEGREYSVPRIQKILPQNHNKQQQNQQKQRSKSNLSTYGSKSLGVLPPMPNESPSSSNSSQQQNPNANGMGQVESQRKNGVYYRPINERDIYEKQQKKYNIITIQPKQFSQTIKKYPIYRLENIDQNYYKKLQLQDQYNRMYKNMGNQQNSKIYTAMSNSKIQQMTSPKIENSSTLNNYSNINQYDNPQYQYESTKNIGEKERNKNFRPKMLNNIDQLKGVL